MDDLDSLSSSSDDISTTALSSDSDSTDDVTSSSPPAVDPLHDMSSLLQQLPFKRGLSKYFNGKSQSFSSLSNVRCLEELAKPESPYKKKLKGSKSYGGLWLSTADQERQRPCQPARLICKKGSSRGSACSGLGVKRGSVVSLVGNRPPIPLPPHRSTSTSSLSHHIHAPPLLT